MSPFVAIVNQILSLLAVVSQVAIIVFFISCFLSKNMRQKLMIFAGKKAILFSFIVALLATSGSLFYSEIAGFEPCKLCWFQRILMYPQVIIFGIALLRRRKSVSDYAITLSSIGLLISGYHYLLQRGMVPAASCSAVGYSVSCSKVFIMNFGYITIPMMAFTAFLLILLLQIIGLRVRKDNL